MYVCLRLDLGHRILEPLISRLLESNNEYTVIIWFLLSISCRVYYFSNLDRKHDLVDHTYG